MRYRAVRWSGSDQWCIELSKRGLCGGRRYVQMFGFTPNGGCNDTLLFDSRDEAEQHIDKLIWRDTDQGEQGEWKP